MKIYFSGQTPHVINRSKYLRGALWKNFHSVYRAKTKNKYPLENMDAWFYGISAEDNIKISDTDINNLRNYSGKIVFFQNDDLNNLVTDKIPDDILIKSTLYLKSHWSKDERFVIPEVIKNKRGLVNPFLKPIQARCNVPFKMRAKAATFIGAMTGGPSDSEHANMRYDAVKMLKSSRINFVGGLIKHPWNRFDIRPDLCTMPISQKSHNELLQNTMICLAFWGNSPMTYRFFEGLANGCLVIAASLGTISFADCGITAGVHYVEIKPDLSNLCDTIEYYLTNVDKAEKIATNGYKFFKQNYHFSGVDYPDSIYAHMCSTWNGLLEKPTYSVRNIVLRPLLKYTKSI